MSNQLLEAFLRWWWAGGAAYQRGCPEEAEERRRGVRPPPPAMVWRNTWDGERWRKQEISLA